jgi:hypothetical protein
VVQCGFIISSEAQSLKPRLRSPMQHHVRIDTLPSSLDSHITQLRSNSLQYTASLLTDCQMSSRSKCSHSFKSNPPQTQPPEKGCLEMGFTEVVGECSSLLPQLERTCHANSLFNVCRRTVAHQQVYSYTFGATRPGILCQGLLGVEL